MLLDSLLVVILLLLPFLNWLVAATLIRLSIISPSIKALSERAGLAVLIAMVTTIYAFVALNTVSGLTFFDAPTVRTVVRLLIIGIGLYPLWWAWSYYTGRFRDEEPPGSGDGDSHVDDAA